MDLQDPKILLSLLMWAVYLVMVYTRWIAGWRGRRAAILASFAFVSGGRRLVRQLFQLDAQVLPS